MKTTKTTVILLALVLLTAAAAQPAEAMVKPKISNTRTASCLVKITSDPAVLPLSDIIIDYLLHSSGVAGKAASEVLNISPDDAFQLFTIEMLPSYTIDKIGKVVRLSSGIPPEPTPVPRTRPARPPEPMVEGILGNTALISGRWCKVGDNIGGAKVLEIKPTYVKVEWQGQQKTLFPVSVGKIVPKPKPTPSRRPAAYEGYTEEEPPSTFYSRRPAAYEGYTEEEPPSTFYSRRPPTRPTTPGASTTSAAEQTYLLKLQVELDGDVTPAAEEFMNALIENLRRALSIAFEDYCDKNRDQQNLAAKEAIRAENKLVKMQNELRNISDYRDLSRSVILNDISNLRRDIQRFEMQNASNRIEMESTAKEIADTEVKIRDKLNNDRIMVELEKIVKIHEEQRKRLAIKGTPEPETAEAGEKLARARIELAKRREEISKAEGGNRVSQLSSKLAQYTQRMAQYELSLSSTKKQLDEAMAFLDRADNYELLSLKADITKQSLQEALLWLEQMDRKARLVQPPTVTVLGGS